jgi:hypothetical protein
MGVSHSVALEHHKHVIKLVEFFRQPMAQGTEIGFELVDLSFRLAGGGT